MNNCYLLFFLLFLSAPAFSQLSGTVTDETGAPLSFASVYLEGTTRGTTTNAEGNYSLDLEPGTYQIVFQYVGYRQVTREIEATGRIQKMDVQLTPESIDLTEVVVKADAEDPAYAIIRKAQAKRTYYRDLIDTYACEVYIKGNIKLLDAPERILGQDVGDLGGILDTNRQGIVYLAESRSKLFFQAPNRYKEVMLETKVSGNDQGFGFNRASDTDFNLYENTAQFNRSIVSPIANNAMSYYRYRLVGTLFDKDGRLINKIEVTPKRPEDPVYRGFIYITEDLWNIQSLDLMLTSGAMKIPPMDTLRLQQVYVPVRQPDVWQVFTQNIDFRLSFFGFDTRGRFTNIYADYNLSPGLKDGFFNNEVFIVEDGANEQPLSHWDSIRPVPLTQDEAVDYARKDSLQVIWESKPYRDSVDRENNRFRPFDVLFGYTYQDSYNRRYFSYETPLNAIQFNTVQGFAADLNLNYRQEYDDYNIRWWELNPIINYGFADQRLRASGRFTFRFEQIHRTELELQGGMRAVQFNPEAPISPFLNTLYSLIDERNFIRLYDKNYAQVGFQRELINGLFLRAQLGFEERSPLTNQSDYSFEGDEENDYASNDPLDPTNFEPSFNKHQAWVGALSLRIRFQQQYTSFPNRRFIQGSPYPDLWLEYRGGFNFGSSDVRYDRISARIEQDDIQLGVWGHMGFRLEAGTFLTSDHQLFFMDFEHFNGNQTFFSNPERYLNSYFLLPYYDYSTDRDFYQAHWQHHFDGWLMDKIPLLRKLGWTAVAGAHFLYTPDRQDYTELTIGLENIGFGLFRIFRFDTVFAHRPDGTWQTGVVMGIGI